MHVWYRRRISARAKTVAARRKVADNSSRRALAFCAHLPLALSRNACAAQIPSSPAKTALLAAYNISVIALLPRMARPPLFALPARRVTKQHARWIAPSAAAP